MPLPAYCHHARRYMPTESQAARCFRPVASGQRRDGRLETRPCCASSASSEQVRLHVWCHGLRHSSINAALDAAGKAGMDGQSEGASPRRDGTL